MRPSTISVDDLGQPLSDRVRAISIGTLTGRSLGALIQEHEARTSVQPRPDEGARPVDEDEEDQLTRRPGSSVPALELCHVQIREGVPSPAEAVETVRYITFASFGWPFRRPHLTC